MNNVTSIRPLPSSMFGHFYATPVTWLIRFLQQLPLPRGKNWLYRHLTLRALRPFQYRVEVEVRGNVRMQFDAREGIAKAVLITGDFEPGEIKALTDLMQGAGWLIDVGANVGYVTSSVKARIPGLHVLAVEPIPSNATRLRRHIELNDLNHVTIANVGLGPQPGRGKALLPVNHAHDTAYARVSVADGGGDLEIVRLDQLWHDLGSFPVAAIKIDVEGAELDVLAGAYELLRHEGPSLLIEALDDAALAQLTTFLATMDYVRSESFKNLTPFDHVFLRADVV